MSFNPVLMIAKGGKPEWYNLTDSYARPRNAAALWQLAANVIPYFLLLGLMTLTVQASLPYGLTLLLALPAAAFFTRIFIILHDCTDG